MAPHWFACNRRPIGPLVGWVDGEAIMRVVFAQMVSRCGGEAHTFSDHAGLLSASAELPFDAVVLQPSDPIDLAQVMAFFRAAPRTIRIVIASDGAAGRLRSRAALLAGFDAVLHKPFSIADVIKALSLGPADVGSGLAVAGEQVAIKDPGPWRQKRLARPAFNYVDFWTVNRDIQKYAVAIIGFRMLLADDLASGAAATEIENGRAEIASARSLLRPRMADGVTRRYWSKSEAAAVVRGALPEANAAGAAIRSRFTAIADLAGGSYHVATRFGDPAHLRGIRQRAIAAGCVPAMDADRFVGYDYPTTVATTNRLLGTCLAALRR